MDSAIGATRVDTVTLSMGHTSTITTGCGAVAPSGQCSSVELSKRDASHLEWQKVGAAGCVRVRVCDG